MLQLAAGIVLYRLRDGEPWLLLMRNAGARHWSFPKGRREDSDRHEVDNARREVEEETGVRDVELDRGFRRVVAYRPVAKVIPQGTAPLTPGASLPDLDESTDPPAIGRLAHDAIDTIPHESTSATGCDTLSALDGPPEPVHKRVTYFLGRAPVGEVRLSGEHDDARWVAPDVARRLLVHASLAEVAEAAFERIAAR